MGYPEFLDIRPYMSEPKGDPVTYGLYAVLVHSGYSCNAGHYFCYVKVSPGYSLGTLSGLGHGGCLWVPVGCREEGARQGGWCGALDMGHKLCPAAGNVKVCPDRAPWPAPGPSVGFGERSSDDRCCSCCSAGQEDPWPEPDPVLLGHSLTTFCLLLPQASNGQWYRMNDHEVHPSNIKVVLNQQAYVLFYLR